MRRNRSLLVMAVVTFTAVLCSITSAWAWAGEGVIPVEGFRFSGHTAFSSATLAEVVADAQGRELNFSELEEVAERITRFYRERGFLVAQAYLPAQDIMDGVVEIAVLEGRYGEILLRNSSRLKEDAVLKVLGIVTEGALIRQAPLERGLRLLNETPGVTARSTLSAGSEIGTSNLTVELHDTERFIGSVTADTYGNKLTGRIRASLMGEVNNLRGWGDRLDARVITTGSGLAHGRIGYSMPLNFGSLRLNSLRLNTAYSTSRHVLISPFASLGADGQMLSWKVGLTYPYRRIVPRYGTGRPYVHYLDLGLAYEARDLKNRIAGLAGVRRAQLLHLSVDGQGQNLERLAKFNAVVTAGTLSIADPSEKMLDDMSAKTSGNYVKFHGQVSERRSAGNGMTVHVGFIWQWASKNLHYSEKLALGGAQAVRAYGPGEVLGDLGLLFRLEVEKEAYIPGFRWVGFVDAGSVQVNIHPWDGTKNIRVLLGAGAGFVYTSPGYFDLRIDYAIPIRDPSNSQGRLGVQAGVRW